MLTNLVEILQIPKNTIYVQQQLPNILHLQCRVQEWNKENKIKHSWEEGKKILLKSIFNGPSKSKANKLQGQIVIVWN